MSNNIEVFEYNDPNARFGFTPNSILNLKEMSNKKQSSVEQVFSHIKASRNDIQYWNDSMLVDWLLEQEDRLKAMHKEEIVNTWTEATAPPHEIGLSDTTYILAQIKKAEQYYNETFGGTTGGIGVDKISWTNTSGTNHLSHINPLTDKLTNGGDNE